MYVSVEECPTCLVEPLLFVRNVRRGGHLHPDHVDGKIGYCDDCGGVYTAPDGWGFLYGDVPVDMSKFRPATLAEIEEAGYGKWARAAQGPMPFP